MDEWGDERGFEVGEAWVNGWGCTVVFDDEVVGGLDWKKLDQLRDDLAACEGISDVLLEDRKVAECPNLSSVEGKILEAVERTGIGYGGYSP